MERYREILYNKYRKGLIDSVELEKGLHIIDSEKFYLQGEKPELYLHMGTAFILSSIVYLAAFNWHGFSSLSKMLIMALVVFIPFFIYNLPISEKYKKLSLFSLEFLIGIMFAVFGQVYQTGADSYMLFVMWSLAIFPMVLSLRYLPSYFLFFIVLSLAAILYVSYLGSVIGVISIINFIPLLIILFINKVLKKETQMVERLEKFFISILFLYFLFGACSYAFYKESYFFVSFAYYLIWAVGIYFYKNEKYYKLLSLIPLFSLIPPLLILTFKDSIDSIESIFVLVLVIIGAYVGLVKVLNNLRGDRDE